MFYPQCLEVPRSEEEQHEWPSTQQDKHSDGLRCGARALQHLRSAPGQSQQQLQPLEANPVGAFLTRAGGELLPELQCQQFTAH